MFCTSIVAIHGLNPFNKQTHAEDTWTAGDKLWLRDFLPKQVPQARVFLYGYNANVVFKTATAGVREQATILLDQIANKRTVSMVSRIWQKSLWYIGVPFSPHHIHCSQLGWAHREAGKSTRDIRLASRVSPCVRM